MRKIFLIVSAILIVNSLEANEGKVCQKCHPIIYSEYYESSHRKASAENNPIHKAMWDKHPKDEKGYTCAKCHSPNDLEVLKSGKLVKNEIQTEEPISCIYCHTIKDVQEETNTNISSNKKREFYTAEKGKHGKAKYETKKSWFGLVKEPESSPYHKIDYSNENFYNGNICMGCHSHVNNEHSFDISLLDAVIGKEDKNSCVTCHMPQVLGTKVTINETKTHAYHGIAGIYHKSTSMGEHIDFNLTKTNGSFSVMVTNKSNHALFGQALRQGVLKITISREGKNIELEPFIFERVVGKDGKVTMPWDADKSLKDTLVYAKKVVPFNYTIKKGDEVKVELGVQIISKDGANKLGLKDSKEFTKFRLLKAEKFNF
ncbi:multiheme c-type cytochrome [Sulfurimonas sp.]|uniref:multiheme c-type cytochrome n=1 Tax=Sulfurimonas sp. TaxID=2022749 RepID=UPI0025E9620B|nr:multiheme c-type cytochrome [Sulfurimonas sp.]MDD5156584.1 multiheme c-type cytochrome [Sulfurimonas sp.]